MGGMSGEPYSDRINAMMAAGLLDELRLWVPPFFVGHGGPQDLLYRDGPLTRFNLVDTTALESGIVILSYARISGIAGGLR
ncbi:MAG TPA: hypothetical protein VHX59_23230 [Mycobacteriales bacterium]|nr:hypothetical protein [Mycobacteriales bacterium]